MRRLIYLALLMNLVIFYGTADFLMAQEGEDRKGRTEKVQEEEKKNSKGPVHRLKDEISIEGSFKYILPIKKNAFESRKIQNKQIKRGIFNKKLSLNTYKLNAEEIRIPIPLIGKSDNKIEFFARLNGKILKNGTIKIQTNKSFRKEFPLTNQWEKIIINPNNLHIKDWVKNENIIIIKIGNVEKHFKVDNKKENLVFFSDINISGKNPVLSLNRLNFKNWVADRFILPSKTRLSINLKPSRNSVLFFSFHPVKISNNKRINDEKYLILYTKNNKIKNILKKIPVLEDQPVHFKAIPLSEISKNKKVTIYFEVRTKQDSPTGIALGNLMVLDKQKKEKIKNIFITTIDTLRADHLGIYGYGRATSPYIDAFSHESTVYTNAYSLSSWTMPAAFSFYFGLRPYEKKIQWGFWLNTSSNSAVESFQNDQFITIALIGNPVVSNKQGFSKGFDIFYESTRGFLSAAQIYEAFNEILNVVEEFPLFMNIWFFDPHGPYKPADWDEYNYPYKKNYTKVLQPNQVFELLLREGADNISKKIIEDMISLYDCEINYVDRYFNKIITTLKKKGLYKNSIMTLFSDHGEEFLDHDNLKHGYSLFEENIHIPLVFRYPERELKGKKMDHPVDITDIFPTIWNVMNMKRPEYYKRGKDLRKKDYERIIFSQTGASSATKVMLKKSHLKFIKFYKEYNKFIPGMNNKKNKMLSKYISNILPPLGLFDLEKDPGEKNNLVNNAEYKKNKDFFENFLKPMESDILSIYDERPKTRTKKDEMKYKALEEKLKALGYMH